MRLYFLFIQISQPLQRIVHKVLQIASGLGDNSAGPDFLSGCGIALLNCKHGPIDSFQNIILSAVRVCARFGTNPNYFQNFT